MYVTYINHSLLTKIIKGVGAVMGPTGSGKLGHLFKVTHQRKNKVRIPIHVMLLTTVPSMQKGKLRPSEGKRFSWTQH